MTISQTTVIQYLEEKEVIDLRISLFNFVQKDDRVWIATNVLSKGIAIVIITNITCCCTDQFETAVRSLYSDISKRIIASLVPNISSANCLASSVYQPQLDLQKEATDWALPSSKPARLRRIARATASTALSWPITLCSKTMSHIFQTFYVWRSHLRYWNTVIRLQIQPSLTLAVTFMSSVWFFRLFSIQQYVS